MQGTKSESSLPKVAPARGVGWLELGRYELGARDHLIAV